MKTKFFLYPFRLIESKDKEGKDWNVALIQAGKSLNKKFYPAEVLKRCKGLFEDVKAFAYKFKDGLWNHLPNKAREVLPEGVVKNVVGWYDKIRYDSFMDENGKPQEGILANFHVSEGEQKLRKFLKDAWEHGKKSLLGFSIDGEGDVTEEIRNGEKVYRVDNIKRIDEVTLVTNPAAGGQFVRLLASLNYEEVAQMDWLKKLYEFAKKFKESLIEGIDPEEITEEQEFTLVKTLVESEDFLKDEESFKEAAPFAAAMLDRIIGMVEKGNKDAAVKLLKQLKDKMGKYEYPTKASKEAEAKKTEEAKKKKEEEEKKAKEAQAAKEAEEKKKREQMTEIEKVKEDLKKMKEDTEKKNCAAMLNKTLSESDLFQPVKDKISKLFEGKIFKQEDIDATIKLEKETLGKLSESGNVKGMGQTKIEVLNDEFDKLQARMDMTLDENAEIASNLKESVKGGEWTSLLQAYRDIHPEDPNVTGDIGRRSKGGRLTEAITNSDFTYIVGTSVTRRVAREFKVKPFLFAPVVSEVPVSDFKQQERVLWGGFSTMPSVSDDADYVDGYEPRDQAATYTAGRKGYIISLSRVAIKNDDMRMFRMIPKKIVKAGIKTLERDTANLLLANGTYTATNTTVFSTVFGNYSTAAMAYDAWTDSKDRISAQKEKGAAEDSGTATATSSTTLTDSSKAWTVDAYIGRYVRIVYGTGAGQIVAITDNDATSVTVAAWVTTPSTDSVYEISMASNDDEEMGLDAGYVIHGLKTRAKVNSLLTSDKNPTNMAEDNIHKGTLKAIYCPLIKGSTYQYYWFLMIGKEDGETIEIGYVDNQRTPKLVVQDQPALGQVFTKNRIRYRVDWEYGLEIIDNRGIDANFATGV